LTHLDVDGNARMVDVSAKAPTERWARAQAVVRMSAQTAALVADGAVPKGDVVAVARIAAIQAAKRTSELIPLCHQLALSHADCSVEVGSDHVTLVCEARTVSGTGVEMEALTAASVGALTVYDMVKGVEKGVVVESVMLLDKTGGKSGDYHATRG
jgi:cyclic pyranopterin phosphate synthase